jgi:Aldehyde dehydrogenase family
MTRRVPYEVVGRIIPFNHPIGFAASRIAPAIVTGNTIVIKPSEQSPLSAAILAGHSCAKSSGQSSSFGASETNRSDYQGGGHDQE